jgi:hypothetical protein
MRADMVQRWASLPAPSRPEPCQTPADGCRSYRPVTCSFMTLLGKVLPTQVSGHEGGPVEMIVTGVRRGEDHGGGRSGSHPVDVGRVTPVPDHAITCQYR